jgi:predicted enzyme related to lactoylglutathione lyase
MPAFIKNLTFDCVDALQVARFWAAALGSDVDEDSSPKRAYVEAPGWGGPNIWFRGERGPKAATNRLHLDLRALTSMDQEVERLVRLGATVVERYGDITVMRDPEGNEFCVEPGPDDPHEPSGR